MRKQGFTLIELLAVIVILAIIAVITVPAILNVIENSKKGAATDSAYGYKEAVNKYYMRQLGKNIDFDMNGKYTINSNGTITKENTNYSIDFTGKTPSGGYLVMANGNVEQACIEIDKYKVTIINGEATNTSIGSCSILADGLYDTTETGRTVYKGTNPDNWLWLDENGDKTKTDSELYRIISYEADGTIKVVRENSINTIAWDTQERTTGNTNCSILGAGCNIWGSQETTYLNGSSLETLNQDFFYKYYATKSATSLTEGDEVTVEQEAALNTYLNSRVENSENSWQPAVVLDEYIEEHDFNVGGIYYTSNPDGDKGFTKEKTEEVTYTWKGKIGLMNITEYVETSPNIACTSVYSNYYFNPDNYTTEEGVREDKYATGQWPCAANNWSNKNYEEWTLTADPFTSNEMWISAQAGFFIYQGVSNNYNVRPSFYLKSTVELDGDGTKTNPYKIIES